MLVFGIDGGGTRSALVALDERGELRLRLAGGPLLLDPGDPAARAIPIAELAAAAAEQLGVSLPVTALCCALAGAGRAHAREAVSAALRERRPASLVHVTTDAEAAFYDALGDGPGILVIAGTGSVVRARNAAGELLRVGGWGQVLGDEGSGYAMGLAVLRAATRAADGRSLDCSLLAPVLDGTGCTVPDQLVQWAAGASKGAIAALAQLAFDVRGPISEGIIAHAAAELAEQVRSVLARGGSWPEPVPLVCAGGLIEAGRPLRAPLLRALAGLGVSFDVHEGVVDGARGAARLALRLAGAPAAV